MLELRAFIHFCLLASNIPFHTFHPPPSVLHTLYDTLSGVMSCLYLFLFIQRETSLFTSAFQTLPMHSAILSTLHLCLCCFVLYRNCMYISPYIIFLSNVSLNFFIHFSAFVSPFPSYIHFSVSRCVSVNVPSLILHASPLHFMLYNLPFICNVSLNFCIHFSSCISPIFRYVDLSVSLCVPINSLPFLLHPSSFLM